ERVLASAAFQGSGRAQALLKFVVEETIGGRTERLKEYTIGAEALGRGEAFDPRTDPIVRAEASRLRSRLERYYAGEGRGDPLLIVLPKGSYVPHIQPRLEATDHLEPPAFQAMPARSAARHRWMWLAAGVAAGAAAMAFWEARRPGLVRAP